MIGQEGIYPVFAQISNLTTKTRIPLFRKKGRELNMKRRMGETGTRRHAALERSISSMRSIIY